MAIEKLDEILLHGICQCDLKRGMWYLDIGESAHIRRGKDLIFNLEHSYNGTIRCGYGSRISVKGRGKILLNSIDNTQITLKNVLYTPSLRPTY